MYPNLSKRAEFERRYETLATNSLSIAQGINIEIGL